MSKEFSRRLLTKVWQFLAAAAMIIVLIVAANQQQAAAEQPAAQEADGLAKLMADSNGRAQVSYNRATGVASFVRLPSGAVPLSLAEADTPAAAADAFFQRYGDAFGIEDATSELLLVDTAPLAVASGVQLTYRQLYEDVPVFAAILKARTNGRKQISSVNGTFVPHIKLQSTAPTLSVERADRIAVDAVAAQNQSGPSQLRLGDWDLTVKGHASQDLAAVNSTLFVFRDGLVQGVPGRDHLVYEVEVINSSISIREFVYVDAHTGEVVEQYSGIFDALEREVSETTLENVVWVEGDNDPIPPGWASGTAQQIIDWQNEIDGAAESYYIFASMAGRDSYDAAGAKMRTVNNDPNIACPNANWNGTSTNYCTGVTGDDTVAHEWGHAYTEYTNNLIYAWQSGALNESYSDIWGDVVDLLNGRGTDAPGGLRSAGGCSIYGQGSPSVDNSYRWLSGEDDPAFGGAIRDLWNPTCYGDPGKVTDAEYWCSADDSGGVHTNSGVPNHAFALLTDGGTYNGQTVTGLGLTKASHIHWGAQTMLTEASNFNDHADALEASCSALIGINLPALSTSDANPGLSGEQISAADCQEVADAIAAVELRAEPTQCAYGPLLDPDAPPLCEGLGTVQSIASEDWEGGTLPAGWSVGSHNVANPPTFDTPDWSVVGDLPAGANGTYAAFVPDLLIGDCLADDESGALYLDSPAYTVPDGALLRMAFDHWMASELLWDGGNLKISVNGGPWQLIPPQHFTFNAYNATLNPVEAGNTNPLGGEPAFSGSDGGQVSGSWGQSQVNLVGLAAPGDEVRFRFDFGVDGCNGMIGWYVDDVQLYSCTEDQGPVCGNGQVELGEQCDDGNTVDGDGCSSVCAIEDGWTCTDSTAADPSGNNIVADWSFEGGVPTVDWTAFSTFTDPLDFPFCGPGNFCPAEGVSTTGSWNVWIGGLSEGVTSSVTQDVKIPATATDLTMQTLRGICDDPGDTLHVSLDGSDIGTVICDGVDDMFVEQTFSVAGYNDGNDHTLAIGGTVGGTNGGHTNFFVDDVTIKDNVSIPASPSVCTEIVSDLTCNAGAIGFYEGIPGSWSVIDHEGSGLIWSDIAGSGLMGNYTGGAGDAASVNSDAFGLSAYNTELRSNKFSLKNASSASVDYLVDFEVYSGLEFLDVDITANGGTTWNNLLSWNESHGNLFGTVGENVSIDLSAYLGLDNLQIRWRYYNDDPVAWDWYAQVDDVALVCEIGPHTNVYLPVVVEKTIKE